MKELKFIHITKTGGTSIEDIGNAHGKKWGRFHSEYKAKDRRNCRWNDRWHDKFILLPDNLKLKYDWFVIIRNPYERIISEYYCRWGGWGIKNKLKSSKEKFNDNIKKKILKNHKKMSSHWVPQHFYIDLNVKIHIIKYENLTEEFNELMKKYNYDITLNKHSNKGKKKFTLNDLSDEVISLINNIYDKDFEMFGYKKINTKN